jgi:hypothetical protein
MSYKLQEFDKTYVSTGAIKLDTIKSLGYIPLQTAADGTLNVDLNDTDDRNDLIPLYTVKVNNEQFQNVIDIDFTEFTVPAQDRTPLLEAEIEALRSDRNRLAKLYQQTKAVNVEQIQTIQEFEVKKFSDRLYRTFALASDANPSKLMSKNKRYILWMQPDGNLVMYQSKNPNGYDVNAEGENGIVIWASNQEAKGRGPWTAAFEADTNFIVRDNFGIPRWNSGTSNRASANAYLILQDTGVLQILDGTRVAWQVP